MPERKMTDYIVDMAAALVNIGAEVKRLGLNDANTNMGAVEVLAKEIRDGFDKLANAIKEKQDA